MEIELIEVINIIMLSLRVTITATVISVVVGSVLGVYIYLKEFKGKKQLILLINSLMSTPPVVMGLLVYLLLSREGILGELQLLFTPTAMIIAQTLLLLPMAMSLIIEILNNSGQDILNTCKILQVDKRKTIIIFLKEIRNYMATVIITIFGRGISEVGSVMLVGGNIRNSTRVMTTYISLSTSMGNFDESLIIATILLLISFTSTFLIKKFQKTI